MNDSRTVPALRNLVTMAALTRGIIAAACGAVAAFLAGVGVQPGEIDGIQPGTTRRFSFVV